MPLVPAWEAHFAGSLALGVLATVFLPPESLASLETLEQSPVGSRPAYFAGNNSYLSSLGIGSHDGFVLTLLSPHSTLPMPALERVGRYLDLPVGF